MKQVSQIIGGKKHAVLSVTSAATAHEAIAMMAEHDIGALVVLDGDKLVGIFSERDFTRRVALAGRDAHETKVGAVMTEKVLCVRPDQSVEEAMGVMNEKRIRHLPVVDGGAVVGVLSMRDAVKEVLSEHRFVINQLEDYIIGSGPLTPARA